jgi:hypothetical protein
MRRLLTVLVLSGAALATLNAPGAQAAPLPAKEYITQISAPAGGGCSPLGVPYCSNRAYAQGNRAAWQWSNQHPSRSQRWPVPYPASTSWNLWRYYHTVYVVRYAKPGQSSQVWKYGITRQVPYSLRANEGRRTCQLHFGLLSKTRCSFNWIAVTNYNHGFYWARYMEASRIKQYENTHWQCPPGQKYSCR